MMKITKEGITFKTTFGKKLFQAAIFLGVFILTFLVGNAILM